MHLCILLPAMGSCNFVFLLFLFLLKKEKSKSSSSNAREPNGFPADTSANSSLLLEFQGECGSAPLQLGTEFKALEKLRLC